MKDILIKVMAVLIIFIVIVIPVFGAIITPAADAEFTPITESTTIEESTTVEREEIKMVTDFADKLAMIQVNCDKEPDLPTEEPATVVIHREVATTQRNNTEEPATIADETTTYPIATTVPEPETASPSTNDYNKWQYQSAITIWNYLKSLGYNNYVCAGIMGNIMSECGGHTLYIEWWLNDEGYYGICQWYKGYYPEIFGRSLEEQLDYLAKTIIYEFNTYGYNYYSGFNYEKFLQLTSIDEAARAFAICYERCATWTYSSRVSNGYKAYQYFVG